MAKFLKFFLILFCAPLLLLAEPNGENVTHGNCTFERIDNLLKVNQQTDKAIINWDDFSIAKEEITKFLQPSAASVVLNRVISNNPSKIYGTLDANGKIFLINQNGILIGKDGRIKTAGFLASTLEFKDDDFLNDNFKFSGSSNAKLTCDGIIESSENVYLIARNIEANGIISAKNGDVNLLAGTEVLLLKDGSKEKVIVSGDGTINQMGLIESVQSNLIAAGGDIYTLAINQEGIIEANGIIEKDGQIILSAETGVTKVSGDLIAKNANYTGGTVHILNEYVQLLDNASIDVSANFDGGEVLIGGDYKGENPDIKNARAVFTATDVTIDASSKESGNGGKIIIWGDELNHFYGTIYAKGGQEKGDGGFVEISSHGSFDPSGWIDTTALNGKTGTLLYDPIDLTISNAVNSGVTVGQLPVPPPAQPDPFTVTFTGSPANINNTALVNALNVNNIIIDVTGAGAGNGDITINNPIGDGTGGINDWTGNFSLSLTATRDIRVSADIKWSSTGTLTMTTGRNIRIDAGIEIENTNSGGVVIPNGIVLTANSGGATTGNFDGIGANAGAGGNNWSVLSNYLDIELDGTGGNTAGNRGIYLNGPTAIIRATNANVTMTGVSQGLAATTNNYGIFLENSASISAGEAIDITGNGGTGTLRNHGIFLDSAASISTTGTALLKLTGNGGAGTTNDNHGISLQADSLIDASATLKMKGDGGIGPTSNNGIHSINIGGNLPIIRSVGDMTLTGTTNGSNDLNVGINATNTTFQVTGNISTITATGTGGTGHKTWGLDLGGGTRFISDAGTIELIGNGGVGTSESVGVVFAGASAISTTGDINITGVSNGSSGNANLGVFIYGNITTSGNVSIIGTGNSGTTGNCYGVGLTNTTNITISGTGTFTVLGTGGNAAGPSPASGPNGILITGTSSATTDSGAISLTGIGGIGTSNNSNGIYMSAGTISSTSGDITFTGTGRSTAVGGTDNNGVRIDGGTINATSGLVKFDGKGAVDGGATPSGTTDNNGILIDGTTLTLATTNEIQLIGVGGGLSTSAAAARNRGIFIDNGGGITASNTSKLSLNGTGGSSGGAGSTIDYGIGLDNGSLVITSSAPLELTATGGTGAIGEMGIQSQNNSTFSTTSGKITMTGFGGVSTSSQSNGISLNDSLVTTLTGDIELTGTAGSATTTDSTGISVLGSSSRIESTALVGGGSITLQGTASLISGTNRVSGVSLQEGQMNTVDGAISITGIGGGANLAGNTDQMGVEIGRTGATDFTISATGTAPITINGISGTGGGTNIGVALGGAANTSITSLSGAININGTSLANQGTANYGLFLDNNTQISSTSGSITVSGSAGAGNSDGIRLDTLAPLPPSINTAGGAAITLTGTRTGTGIGLNVVTGSVGDGTTNGPITITADTLGLPALTSITTNGVNGSMLIQPVNIATSINLGDTGIGTLSLSGAEMGRITTGTPGLTIGRADGAHSIIVQDFTPVVNFSSLVVRGDNITFNDAINIGTATPLEARIGQTGVGSFTFNNKVTFVAFNFQAFGEGNAIDNTFNGGDPTNTWNITADNEGTFTNASGFVVPFFNFGNLVGSTVDDVFIFASQVQLDGLIDGGVPPQINTMDYSAWDPPPVIVYTAPYDGLASNLGIGFFNIGNIIYVDILDNLLAMLSAQLDMSLAYRIMDPSKMDLFSIFQFFLLYKAYAVPNIFWQEMMANVFYYTRKDGLNYNPKHNFFIQQPFLKERGSDMNHFFFPPP